MTIPSAASSDLDWNNFTDALVAEFQAMSSNQDGREITVTSVSFRRGKAVELRAVGHVLPGDTSISDTIPAVDEFVQAFGISTAQEFAAFWMTELEEQVLGSPE